MKRVLLVFFILFFGYSNAQGVPPPGSLLYSVIDEDNDGYTEFDINYFLETFVRNRALSFGMDLSGYQLLMFPSGTDTSNAANAIGPTFTNTVQDEQTCIITLTYTGTGPQFSASFLSNLFGAVVLVTIPYNGDQDGDGVLNFAEDLNSNRILIDNDTDGDGIFNFKDTDDDGDSVLTINEDYNGNGNPIDDDLNSNSIPDYLDNTVTGLLQLTQNDVSHFKIYPNPTQDSINFDTTLDCQVTLFDTNGRVMLKDKNKIHSIDLSSLNSGVYFLRIQNNEIDTTRKIIKI